MVNMQLTFPHYFDIFKHLAHFYTLLYVHRDLRLIQIFIICIYIEINNCRMIITHYMTCCCGHELYENQCVFIMNSIAVVLLLLVVLPYNYIQTVQWQTRKNCCHHVNSTYTCIMSYNSPTSHHMIVTFISIYSGV